MAKKFFEFVPSNVNYDFIGFRSKFLFVSSIAILASFVLIATRGLNFGLDFRGGTEVQIEFTPCAPNQKAAKDCVQRSKLNTDTMRKSILGAFPGTKLQIQKTGKDGTGFLLKFGEVSLLTKKDADRIKGQIKNAFGKLLVSAQFRKEGGNKIDLVFSRELKGPAKKKKAGTPTKIIPGKGASFKSKLPPNIQKMLDQLRKKNKGKGLNFQMIDPRTVPKPSPLQPKPVARPGAPGARPKPAFHEDFAPAASRPVARPVAARPVAPAARPVARPVAPVARPVAPVARPVAPAARPVAPVVRRPVAPVARPVAARVPAAKPTARVKARPATPAKLDLKQIAQLKDEFKRLSKLFAVLGLGDIKISNASHQAEDRYEYSITFAGLSAKLTDKLGELFGANAFKILQVESVGPSVGKKLREDGIISILLANLFILIYISIRFDFRYAPGAVAALLHDVTITTGLFSLLQLPFDLAIIAALLTIIGYSLNDTIVVYDRIRENWQKSKINFGNVMNRSINETLSRTLLTSLTTFVAVVPIYIIGGSNIKWFAFAMMFGILIGTYSSIAIASPLVYYLDQYFSRKQRDEDSELEEKRDKRRRRRAGLSERPHEA